MKSALVLGVLVLAGCPASSSPPPQYGSAPPPAAGNGNGNSAVLAPGEEMIVNKPGYSAANPDNKSTAGAIPAHSVWSGRYSCGTEKTAVTLTLDVGAGGAATALFAFGPDAENQGAARGSFRLKGSVADNGEGQNGVKLQPDAWVGAAPQGYEMVGLHGGFDQTGRFIGVIENDACSSINMQRQ